MTSVKDSVGIIFLVGRGRLNSFTVIVTMILNSNQDSKKKHSITTIQYHQQSNIINKEASRIKIWSFLSV